jgi:hypothetical protein
MSILSQEDKTMLLKIARHALDAAVKGEKMSPLNVQALPAIIKEPGCSFVTLTIRGELRGCIGALEPTVSLAEDVRDHAVAAALDDYRFPPVRPVELESIAIEISYLTSPKPLIYSEPPELPRLLRPGIDGVVLRDGFRRATFLPQVWQKLPDPEDFLSHLCQKMGAPPNLWKQKVLQVETYQVDEFHE